MTNKPRHRRNPDPRRRGLGATGTGLGMAVGGAMAAVFVSMSSASADDPLAPVTHDDAFTELAQRTDPSAVTGHAVQAKAAAEDAVTQLTQTTDPSAVTGDAVPAQATLDAFEQRALQIDPNAFTAAGDPNDFIGTIVSQIDTDLATTVFGPEVNTIAGQVSCLLDGTCTDLLSTVPTTGDDGFTVLDQFLTQDYIPSALPLVLVPGLDSDLATIASQLDAYFADTVFGPEWFTIAEQIISGLTTAADPAAFVP
jgi:hypothetical protein